MFHLSLSSDRDVSLVPTLWRRCFTCPYAPTQLFHSSLRSDTDASLVTNFTRPRFPACHYAGTHVGSLLVTHWHSSCLTSQNSRPNGKTYPSEIKYLFCFHPHFHLQNEAMQSLNLHRSFRNINDLTKLKMTTTSSEISVRVCTTLQFL